jgi:RsiW-degrading membrane proteinase PrsW (M82 family)
MDKYFIFIPLIGIGLAYFTIIMFLKKTTKITYLTGLWLPLVLVVVLFALSFYAQINPQPGSWNDLVFATLTSVMAVILATYLIAWGITVLVQKKK